MANKRITDIGLLLYYTSYDEISKIDTYQLGDLIKKEIAWMSGRAEEPTFDDVMCDIFHMHIKEQIEVREMARKGHGGKDLEPEQQQSQNIQSLPECKPVESDIDTKTINVSSQPLRPESEDTYGDVEAEIDSAYSKYYKDGDIGWLIGKKKELRDKFGKEIVDEIVKKIEYE